MFVRLILFFAAVPLAACRTPLEQIQAELVQPGPAALAQEAVSLTKRDFQVKLDYSKDSVRQVEEIAFKQRALPDPDRQRFMLLWQSYLGEVARRHNGAAAWQFIREGFPRLVNATTTPDEPRKK